MGRYWEAGGSITQLAGGWWAGGWRPVNGPWQLARGQPLGGQGQQRPPKGESAEEMYALSPAILRDESLMLFMTSWDTPAPPLLSRG